MPYLLALTFLLTPAYAVKFQLLGFPTNLLMAWVVLVWLTFAIWLIVKKQVLPFWSSIAMFDKKLLALVGLFFLAGLVSLFAHGFDRAKLGQFIVLFLQPISLFFIGRYLISQFPKTRNLLITTCYLLLGAMGIYAVIQYFTLVGLPPAWWGNSEEPKRALGFFGHPNFYALFSTPLLAFLIPDVVARFIGLPSSINGATTKSRWIFITAWIIGATGLFLSLSRAGWLGLGMAILAYLIFAANAKIRRLVTVIVIVMVTVVTTVSNLRYRVVLPFYGEKSAVSRLSLWETGWKGIKESPLTGLGLTGFARQWQILNTDPGLASASHNFPHNIFLDLWVETGLLGLISFVGLIFIYIYRGLRNANRQPASPDASQGRSLNVNCYGLSVALFLIALIFAGLVDNPYFKNDLAMVFWLVLSLV
ncbi:MAG: O-antigen ligase family protein [Patescibacteria group bacterium]|nr:O-antigen ligase family protein [Patescibacteria group bacterium]